MGIMNIGAASSNRTQRTLDFARHFMGEWWQRMRSRYELESLGERDLQDIGISEAEAKFEASKAFWR